MKIGVGQLFGIRLMDLTTLLQLFIFMIVSCVAAIAGLRAYSMAGFRHSGVGGTTASPEKEIVFLFEDEKLLDASDEAKNIMQTTPESLTDLDHLLALLASQFPDLHHAFTELPEQRSFEIHSTDGNGVATARMKNGTQRLIIRGFVDDSRYVRVDRDCYAATERELSILRTTADIAPFLVWREMADGTITWANNAYLELAEKCDPDLETSSWPPARLFAIAPTNTVGNGLQPQRLTTHLPGEAEPRWFECVQAPLGDDRLFTAISADKTIKAEISLRDFMQTLTKTFANLKIGLAIFDKQRRLAIFNPALADLTSLPVEFLIQRPTLHSVLDRLREKRMIPEQRDYKSWRKQLFDLEVAAENGTYEETWALASGNTYRVTGNPHPDGALAFLMEDISAEISLTRRFRMELETGQAVIDSLEEAIAVFSTSGTLTLSNASYARLWGLELTDAIGSANIVDASRAWGTKCAPTPVWGDARDFVSLLGERSEWTADVRLSDGRNLSCRFAPLARGGTLAGFTICQPVATQSESSLVAQISTALSIAPA